MPKLFGIFGRRKTSKESPETPPPPIPRGDHLIQSAQLSSVSGSLSPFQKLAGGNKSITPPTKVSEAGGIFYTGLKLTLEALRGPATAFPPLKAAVEGTISILTIVDVCA